MIYDPPVQLEHKVAELFAQMHPPAHGVDSVQPHTIQTPGVIADPS